LFKISIYSSLDFFSLVLMSMVWSEFLGLSLIFMNLSDLLCIGYHLYEFKLLSIGYDFYGVFVDFYGSVLISTCLDFRGWPWSIVWSGLLCPDCDFYSSVLISIYWLFILSLDSSDLYQCLSSGLNFYEWPRFLWVHLDFYALDIISM